MTAAVMHRWDVAAVFAGRRGRLYEVIACRWCDQLATRAPGCAPRAPRACIGVRPVVPITWSTPRAQPTWAQFFAARG